jgi:chaperone BCS1
MDLNARWNLWTEWLSSFLYSVRGVTTSLDAFFLNSSYLRESVKLLVLGSIIETGRRLCQWLIERFRLRG